MNGEPSKNPRYLQDRPDLTRPEERYIAMRGLRLFRRLPANAPIHQPVSAVLSGRRNNPPDRAVGIRSLAVFNPIHYQELPELFMDYVCSLTGKSPSRPEQGVKAHYKESVQRSTTDSRFECCSSKYNYHPRIPAAIQPPLALSAITLKLAMMFSLLVPELWCRLTPQERDPDYLISEGMLEPIEDILQDGAVIPASRLGYRITSNFVRRLFGRMFDNPDKVFDDRILRPETQDREAFVDGIQHIVEAQQRVALQYFEDGSYEAACPPLQAVLSVMAHGNWNGKSIKDADVRALFTRESMLGSDWYGEFVSSQTQFRYSTLATPSEVFDQVRQQNNARRCSCQNEFETANSRSGRAAGFLNTPAYLQRIEGTLGTDPAIHVEPPASAKPTYQSAGV